MKSNYWQDELENLHNCLKSKQILVYNQCHRNVETTFLQEDFHSYSEPKRSEVSIKISNKTFWKSNKKWYQSKEGHYVLIKISDHQEKVWYCIMLKWNMMMATEAGEGKDDEFRKVRKKKSLV